MSQPQFVDRVQVHARAGDGGDGCASIRREKFRPLGGPDGGNGGRGGSIILRVDPSVTTLLDLHRRPHLRADNGRAGRGSNRDGATGADVIVSVPDGTTVRTQDGEIITDLVGPGAEFVLASGGQGGLGNAALANRRRKAPGFALLGGEGEEAEVLLELRTVADVALVGYPSAGKSSLIAAMSAARPKIADYPFTTLTPNLGVVRAGQYTYTIADVPGLVPGASAGKGLGLEFLRHIERCSVICHVIDAATLESDRDPLTDLSVIESELTSYGGLSDRPRVIVLNKVDIPEAKELAEFVAEDISVDGAAVFAVSAVSHEGLQGLAYALGALVEANRPIVAVARPRTVLRPEPVDDRGFTVETTEEGYRVHGERPRRLVEQTDFSNDEAVGYLAERLARLGVEEELLAQGAQPGATVIVGGADPVVFEWEPMIDAADRGPVGPRGTDETVAAVEHKHARRPEIETE